MSIRFPEQFPALSSERLLLRELEPADIPAWFKRASDPDAALLSGDPIPEDVEVVREWFELHLKRFRDQLSIRWAIVPTDESTSVGSIGITNLKTGAEATAELGAVITRAYWNKGLATEAAERVIDYCFSELGLRTLRADAIEFNGASRRVLEKLGFTEMGVIDDYERAGDKTYVGYLYELKR